jgi:transposase
MRALKGLAQPHRQTIIRSMLAHIEALDAQIAALDDEIGRRLADKRPIVEALDEICGVGEQSAQVIISEMGADMSRFPSAKHLSSWAGASPANHESAGKKKRAGSRKGNSSLKKTLVQCGRAAANTKNTYLNSMYRRIAARRGKNVACVAVARTILEICYYMIRDNTSFKELGPGYFDEQNRANIMKRSVKRLESLGFKVSVEDVA